MLRLCDKAWLRNVIRPNKARFSTNVNVGGSLDASVVSWRKVEGKGRALFAQRTLKPGDVVLDADPLVACADAASAETTCQACFRALPAQPVVCLDCGERYCSEACRQHATAFGHALLCGGMREMDAYCSEQQLNTPRVAAHVLARAFCGHPSLPYESLWEAINELQTVSVKPDEDAMPLAWKQGFALTKGVLMRKISAGGDYFFSEVFNLRAYVRLMGTLRVNSFSITCPLTPGHVGASHASPQPATDGSNAPLAKPSAAVAAVHDVGAPESAAADAAACASGGSCSPDAGGDGGSCGSGGCGSGADDAAYLALAPKGGTALYRSPSFANHDCDPNMDVVIGPFGAMQLRARRHVQSGEELTITYLDSSMAVNVRRGKLLHGYGFECRCATCNAQMKELQASLAAQARAERAKEQAEGVP